MNKSIDAFKAMQEFKKPYISLSDRESIRIVRVKAMEYPFTDNFDNEVMHMVCDVELQDPITGKLKLTEKYFNKGTQKWSDELSDNKIEIGSAFTLTRKGEGTKTEYIISDVDHSKEVEDPTGGTFDK